MVAVPLDPSGAFISSRFATRVHPLLASEGHRPGFMSLISALRMELDVAVVRELRAVGAVGNCREPDGQLMGLFLFALGGLQAQ